MSFIFNTGGMYGCSKFFKNRETDMLYGWRLPQCPIFGLSYDCASKEGQEKTVVERVKRWAQEHPAKTRLNDFLGKYPDATLDKSGIPEGICVKRLGYKGINCDDDGFCDQCWNQPIE